MRSSPYLLTAALLASHLGCGSPGPFTPPDWPPHDKSEDDFRHARGLNYPFLCPAGADPAKPEIGLECAVRVRTTTSSGVSGDPEDAYLSCDAVGCHGSYDYREAGGSAAGRHLLGAEGPSCYSCHDRKWHEDEPKTGPRELDEKEDD